MTANANDRTIEQVRGLREQAEVDILNTLRQLYNETGLPIQRVDVVMVSVSIMGVRDLMPYPNTVRVELRL